MTPTTKEAEMLEMLRFQDAKLKALLNKGCVMRFTMWPPLWRGGLRWY